VIESQFGDSGCQLPLPEGKGQARELTGVRQVEAVITCDSPEIQHLLTHAFGMRGIK
jgi:hypothetical protein